MSCRYAPACAVSPGMVPELSLRKTASSVSRSSVICDGHTARCGRTRWQPAWGVHALRCVSEDAVIHG